MFIFIMKNSLSQIFLLTICLTISRNCGMMLRNNALMSKMVSDFHAPKARTVDIMRNVLCKHFPSIPCKLIIKDEALRNLILRTVKLLSDKKRELQNVTVTTEQQVRNRIPAVNSDELSQYLAVENTGYFTEKHKNNKERYIVTPKTLMSDTSMERAQLRHAIPGHKNIRKYFPHKIRYKDRNDISDIDKTQEKMSLSEEIPGMHTKKFDNFSHKKDGNNLPMWQIDYTKHGDPRLPNFSQETDQLRGKLVNNGADTENNVIKHRTGVLHPNVYIKNSVKRVQSYE